MKQKSVALFLILLVVGSEANKAAIYSNVLDLDKINGLGESANINEYIDNTVPMLVNFITTHDLDPMPLPDMVEGFKYKPLLIEYTGELSLTQGSMVNLVSVCRDGDAVVSYFAKMLRVRIVLGFDNLEFYFTYRAKLMDIGPSGGLQATLSHLTVVIDILIDFNNDEAHLQDFLLSEIGRLRVRLTGNFLTDWFVNPIIALFTTLLNSVIMNTVETNIRNAINAALAALNAQVKDIMAGLE